MIFKRLKSQLLFAFSIVIFLLVLTLLVSGYLYVKKSNVSDNIHELDDIRVLALKNFKLLDDYISYETINEKYFATGESRIKKEFERNYFTIIERINGLKPKLNSDYGELTAVIDSLLLEQKNYYSNFSKLEELVLSKGFKDNGVEGRMREYAHLLMSIENHSINYLALSLRRHEKDFIIRKDGQYQSKFNEEFWKLPGIIQSSSIPVEKKIKFLEIAENYKKYFNIYCNYQFELGTNENEGLLRELKLNYQEIDSLFDKSKIMSVVIETSFHNKLRVYNITLIFVSILFAVFLAYFYSLRVTKAVLHIKNSISDYIDTDFKVLPMNRDISDIEELKALNNNFLHLAREINSYLNHFKIKVEERTAEIRWQKEEILQQNLKISSQHDRLHEQQKELLYQQSLLSEKNQNLVESIKNAERIQKALLPSTKLFSHYFSETFMFFRPKDIVSGDFYWIEEIEVPVMASALVKSEMVIGLGKDSSLDLEFDLPEQVVYQKRLLFAIADCTGHGVPGAFMSIMGINYLNKIVKESRIFEPDDILNSLNRDIKQSFYKGEDDHLNIKDGMEVAFCSYLPDKSILQFSGANKNLLMIRSGHIYEFKGNKKPVGIYPSVINTFEKVDIKVLPGDIVYLFTDGYQDQFGGKDGKKFKTKNLKKLLLSICSSPMNEQYDVIKNNFECWKGEGFQVDDVLMIGIKF